MKFNALIVVKYAVSGVVGLGAGKIVSGIVKDHVKPETLIDKVSIAAATWTLSGILTTATKKYTSETIDDTYKSIVDTLNDFKLSAKLNRINNGLSTFADEGLNESDYEFNSNDKYVYVGEKSDDSVVTEDTNAAN